ncbi:hypothetical protein [Streptomyces sp. NPDC097610]|uniref:DUF7064 domain-containing protein n=1 Tax=Streptomyces sp. NPDC097610 TaxID=3157227 RepID=UPI00332407D0
MAEEVEWITSNVDNQSFGDYGPKDDLFHGTGPEGDSLAETWYWGFNVPEAAINCFVYCKVYVNLGVALAGLFIYRGVKRHHLASELFDVPAFMSSGFVGDGSDIRVPNGLRIQVVAPLDDIHLTFNDPARETEVDVHLKAVAPPIMRANGKHFEQIMKTGGHIVLRGERHVVDGYNVRDRSWGELRPEGHVHLPPYNWVTGVTEDGSFAFNVGSHDDPERSPHWSDHFDVPPEKAFKDGWVWDGDQTLRIVRASKRTERDPETLAPTRHVIDIEDTDGVKRHITGDVVASVPWGSWHNIQSHLGLVRWSMDGRTAWGESQDVQWNDYVWRYGQAFSE